MALNSYILQEDGFKLVLEEGGGFLIIEEVDPFVGTETTETWSNLLREAMDRPESDYVEVGTDRWVRQ